MMARLTQQYAFCGVGYANFGLMLCVCVLHFVDIAVGFCAEVRSSTVDVVFEAYWWWNRSGAYLDMLFAVSACMVLQW